LSIRISPGSRARDRRCMLRMISSVPAFARVAGRRNKHGLDAVASAFGPLQPAGRPAGPAIRLFVRQSWTIDPPPAADVVSGRTFTLHSAEIARMMVDFSRSLEPPIGKLGKTLRSSIAGPSSSIGVRRTDPIGHSGRNGRRRKKPRVHQEWSAERSQPSCRGACAR